MCRVREITVDEHGMASGVIYYDAEGKEQFQPAEVVILACNGVGTPRLMLNSVSAKFPNGIANSSGLVGKNLMFHPYALTYGYVDEPLDGNHGPPLCLWSQEFYETDPKRDFVRGYTFQFGRGVGAIMEAIVSSNAGRLPWGEDHHRVYRKLLNHRISLAAICEDLPEEHNRVTLDPVLKDSSGIPAPKLDYTISANSLKMMDHGIARAKEVLTAAGASNIAVESADPERRLASARHRAHGHRSRAFGGERMGPLPRREEPVHRRRQHLGDVGRRQPDLDHPGAGALHRRQHQAAPRQSVRLRAISMQNHDLTADQARDLRALAGMIIPPSTVYDVPGADDEKIFSDILRNLERDRDDIRRALSHLAAIGGGAFADLEAERRTEVATAFREVGGAPLAALVRVVLLCYYRDDRVMRSLGQEAASAVSQGACGGAGRLVAARSGPRPAADVSHGRLSETAVARSDRAAAGLGLRLSSAVLRPPPAVVCPARDAHGHPWP